MRITPMDIRQQQFTVKMFRGFDVQEVDTFLEDVAEDYEALVKENALLKEQLQALEERTRGLEDREKRAPGDPDHHPARLRGDEGVGARREASLIVREAELRGEKQLEAARGGRGACCATRSNQLKRQRRQLAEGLRSTIEMYQRLIAQDLAESAPDAARTPASA